MIVGVLVAWSKTIFENIRWLETYARRSTARNPSSNRGGASRRHPRLHSWLDGVDGRKRRPKVSIGPRPYFLIDQLDGEAYPKLKQTLEQCARTIKTFQTSDFVLGHRGAALEFPEHSDRGHNAASRLGAGIVECDINLTKDRQLICRHERCDLHLTTDILLTPLAGRCSRPFRPATPTTKAFARCCTTDFTLEEIQTHLCSRMSSSNPRAKTPRQYVSHNPSYRTDLYSHDCPHIQSHRDFIDVVDANGGSFVPEFKMLEGRFFAKDYTRRNFLDQVLADYNETDPERVYPQSFDWEDLYYVAEQTDYGVNTLALDKNWLATLTASDASLREYFQPLLTHGVTAIAPALFMLLEVGDNNTIVPSSYARIARDMGLDIVPWTLERSDALAVSIFASACLNAACSSTLTRIIETIQKGGGWYFSKLSRVLREDADILKVLDVLYEDVGIKAIWTDWPSIATFYANCKGIDLR